MTELDKIKEAITASTRDEELASATCYEVEAYVKLWPFVFLVNDWDIWNGSKGALKLQVVRWLEGEGAPYDFFHIRAGFGLMASTADWNPHPVKSTFEPVHAN